MRLALARAAFAAGAILFALAACDRDSARDKIEVNHEAPARNTQTYASGLFDTLCAERSFGAAECGCMRDRMLRAGTRAMAYVGATYGGNLAEAAASAEDMDESERATAIQAYFTAESVCLGAPAGPAAGMTDVGLQTADAPSATLDDVRASCRPAMAEVCACRARALAQTLGDGAYEAAIAINTGARARLETLGQGRQENWAAFAADAYARTSAPCIVEAGR